MLDGSIRNVLEASQCIYLHKYDVLMLYPKMISDLYGMVSEFLKKNIRHYLFFWALFKKIEWNAYDS